MEEPTNKELLHFIKDIQTKVADIKEKDLPEINGRLKITNGSVADVKAWKERVTGAVWTMGIVCTLVVIPLLTWAFITISNIPENIDKSVKQSIINNEVK